MNVICEIEKARQRLGVSVGALASEAGINHSTYLRAVRGVTRPRQGTYDKLLDALRELECQAEKRIEDARGVAA